MSRVLGWKRSWALALAALVASLLAPSNAGAQTGALDDVTDDAYYAQPVAELAAQGVFEGTLCDRGFCPGEVMDRKTMAVWVVRLLDGSDPAPSGGSSFTDVEHGSFHWPFIERMAELGVTSGCGDGTRFCPDRSVTRAQMAVFLTRAYDLAEAPDPGFWDVFSDAWYAAEVASLAASGITLGCRDGSVFCPDADTTRAQMATFLHRAEQGGGQSAPPVEVPTDGSVAVVPRAQPFMAQLDTLSVEGLAGVLSDEARLQVQKSSVGTASIGEGSELAADPVELSVTGAEILRPLTLRVQTDTASLTPEQVVPAYWSSEDQIWVPIAAESIDVRDGEILVRATLSDAEALSGSDAALRRTAMAGANSRSAAAPLAAVVIAIFKVFVVTGAAVTAVALTSSAVRDYLAEFFALRVDDPCPGDSAAPVSSLPLWVDGLSDSDQELREKRARLHACAEGDGNHLSVTVVNNRNYGIQLRAAPGDHPVSLVSVASPSTLVDFLLKELGEWQLGDSYLWPLSTSEFLVPQQRGDWRAEWRPTWDTASIDVLRFAVDLLFTVVLPRAVSRANVDDSLLYRGFECVKNHLNNSPSGVFDAGSRTDWRKVFDLGANLLKNCLLADLIALPGLPKGATAGFKHVTNALSKVAAAESAAKWGITFADSIRDGGEAPAWVEVDVNEKAHDIDPVKGPDRGFEPFSDLDAGEAHTCALRADKSVACWGAREELSGIELDVDFGQTRAPSGAFDYISAGQFHSCGVRVSGAIECWGRDTSGQASPPSERVFIGVTSGASHSCGLRRDRTITCWGGNSHRQIQTPTGEFVSVVADGDRTCAVRVSGTSVCWGQQPLRQPARDFYNSVYPADDSTYGLRTDGLLDCWGECANGRDGQLDGKFKAMDIYGNDQCSVRTNSTVECWGQRFEPSSFEGTAVTVGPSHVCWRTVERSIECGGYNDYGQTDVPADLSEARANAPNPVASLDPNLAMDGGGLFSNTCALRVDSTLSCGRLEAPSGTFQAVTGRWGVTCGIRSDSTVTCWAYSTDSTMSFSTELPGPFTAVDAGINESCGIRVDGTITCWPAYDDPYGTYDPYGILDVPSGAFKAISVGLEHACGIRVDGSITCWGANDHGGTDAPPAGRFEAVSIGPGIACGIRIGGSVTCWDHASRNDVWPRSVPRGTFKAISAGERHACGIRVNGTINCWGDYATGVPSHLPDGPSGTFDAISAFQGHTCGRRTGGTIICWYPEPGAPEIDLLP